MGKFGVRKNYEDYGRVRKAFKEFIHALVWESVDIDEGVEEDEINEHIDKYCKANADQMIALTNDSVSKFITSLYARYEVAYYEYDENLFTTKVCSISTNNLEVALKKAADYYRGGKKPYVEVFDNETKKFIAKWSGVYEQRGTFGGYPQDCGQ